MLAVVGAVGDLQQRRHLRLVGVNQDILADGVIAGVLEEKTDIQYFGRETRPVYKMLQYASDPIIPGVTGLESHAISFLKDLSIPVINCHHISEILFIIRTGNKDFICPYNR